MQKIPLKAEERTILGKNVKTLRKQGIIPGHVYGQNQDSESVSVFLKEFLDTFDKAGETGVIDLRIGAEKVRPVMIKDVQYDPVRGQLLNIDFYQVNLNEKVTVPVPLVLKELEEEIESVKLGEAVVLQTLSEVQVEALPTDLIDQIEVDLSSLKNIDDAITVSDLKYDRETLTVLAEGEEVVVKLAPAVTEEMKQLIEEQEAETAAAQEGEEGTAEGENAEGGEEETTDENGGAEGEKSGSESVEKASEKENS